LVLPVPGGGDDFLCLALAFGTIFHGDATAFGLHALEHVTLILFGQLQLAQPQIDDFDAIGRARSDGDITVNHRDHGAEFAGLRADRNQRTEWIIAEQTTDPRQGQIAEPGFGRRAVADALQKPLRLDDPPQQQTMHQQIFFIGRQILRLRRVEMQ
jgi:hypothetical protein